MSDYLRVIVGCTSNKDALAWEKAENLKANQKKRGDLKQVQLFKTEVFYMSVSNSYLSRFYVCEGRGESKGGERREGKKSSHGPQSPHVRISYRRFLYKSFL